jgi:GMP synthase-like glutamine amidotransferase
MKILLVNNHTVHINSLAKELAGHQIEVQTYKPGIKFHDEGKDLVILSGGGGEGLEIHDEYVPGRLWYEDEMRLVLNTKKPILGVCMGAEVIARTYGTPITSAGGLVLGREGVELSNAGKQLFGTPSLIQYEAHRYLIEDLPKDFEVLATSKKNGKKPGIEIFRYYDGQKSILGTQFHPEKGGTLQLSSLISQASSL